MTDEQVFQQTLELPIDERCNYIARACSDSEQKKRVTDLIAAHQQEDSLLDHNTMNVETEDKPCIPSEIGDFEVLRELGRGGMGVVYEAKQKSLKRKVALKVLSSGLGLSSKAILRFRREAEAAGKLHHTNIVPIYTTGADRGVHFYAMELIDGPSLDAVIRDLQSKKYGDSANAERGQQELPAWVHETALFSPDAPQPKVQPSDHRADENSRLALASGSKSDPQRQNSGSCAQRLMDSNSSSSMTRGGRFFDTIATMIADVADALDHAHEHGVIHRDVKPSNLLLAPDGRLSINDFGLARMLEQPGMTISGEFVGSPLYMSPEQITAGRVQLDHRTDIYSLGSTLYELLTGKPPFPGQTRDQVLSQILHKEAVSTRKLNRKVPVDLDTICMKAIDKDPDRRYQTAGQLADDLRKYVNRHAISARRIGPVRSSLRWIKRNPSWAGLGLVVLLSAGSLIWSYQSNRSFKRESAKQAAMEYSIRGEKQKAAAAIDRARENGASTQWLSLMKAQSLLFESDFKNAGNIIQELSLNEEIRIPALSLSAISSLYDGLESEQVRTITLIREIANERDLNSTECLYVGLALMWAEPIASLEYLDRAEAKGVSGAVLRLLRTHAYGNASLDTYDERDAKGFAQRALRNAALARADMPDSQFAILREFAANLNAIVIHRREGSDYQLYESQNDILLRELSTNHGSNNSTIYQFLVEAGRADEALRFVHRLNDDQLVDYLRIYRMFTALHVPDEFDYNVEEDAALLVHHGEYREPTKQLVQLASGVSPGSAPRDIGVVFSEIEATPSARRV